MIKNRYILAAWQIIRNKYVFVLIIFVLWMLFFDSNNIVDRYKELRRIKNLKRDIEFYNQKIKSTNERINELKTDRKNLEKFAREQYLMKKENEDVFVIVEE